MAALRADAGPLAKALREAIDRSSMTQGEVARKAKIQASTLSGWIQRGKTPRPGKLDAVARALGVGVEDLRADRPSRSEQAAPPECNWLNEPTVARAVRAVATAAPDLIAILQHAEELAAGLAPHDDGGKRQAGPPTSP